MTGVLWRWSEVTGEVSRHRSDVFSGFYRLRDYQCTVDASYEADYSLDILFLFLDRSVQKKYIIPGVLDLIT